MTLTRSKLLIICFAVAALTAEQARSETLTASDVRNYWSAEDDSGINVNDSVSDMDAALQGFTLPTFSTTAKVGMYSIQHQNEYQSASGMNARAAWDSSFADGGYSYSCWLNVNSAGGGTGDFGRIFTTRYGYGMVLCFRNDAYDSSSTDGDPSTLSLRLDMTLASGSPEDKYSNDVINTGEWTHLVLTRSADDNDGNTTFKVYLDGSEATSLTQTVEGYGEGLWMGVAGNFTRSMDGLMDEMIMFNRELTADEVGSFYSTCGGEFGNLSAVPEPSTLALLVGSLIGLLAYAWRKRK